MTRDVRARVGAYGLTIRGALAPPQDQSRLFPPAPAHWPEVELDWAPYESDERPKEVLDESRAVVHLMHGGYLTADRAERRVIVRRPRRPDQDEVAHPLFAVVGMLFGYWLGREQYHGGAVLAPDGRAWGVVGEKGAGKSTLMAVLAREGWSVLSDDLIVIESGRVTAGPRVIDLRLDVAGLIDAQLRPVRGSERRRLDLPATAVVEAPLGGWLVLTAGREVRAWQLAPRERLPALQPHRAVFREPRYARTLLELVDVPCYRLVRPTNWQENRRAVDTVTSIVAAVRPRGS